jgi:hypothetical protein
MAWRRVPSGVRIVELSAKVVQNNENDENLQGLPARKREVLKLG